MQDEGQIIQRVLSGETSAFRQIVDLCQPFVFQFVRNILKKHEDAEDLTQDVFVAAFRNLASFDPSKAQLTTWLLTIARNLCCNQMKRRTSTTIEDVDVTDRQPGPDVAASSREVWRDLDTALESLPFDQRTAFVLAEIQELPLALIAEIEGVEVGTVKSRLSRAREQLRQSLRAWRPESSVPPRSHS